MHCPAIVEMTVVLASGESRVWGGNEVACRSNDSFRFMRREEDPPTVAAIEITVDDRPVAIYQGAHVAGIEFRHCRNTADCPHFPTHEGTR